MSASEQTPAQTTWPPGDLLTLPAASRRCGLSVATLRRRIDNGELPAYQLAGKGKLLIDPADLAALMVPVQPRHAEPAGAMRPPRPRTGGLRELWHAEHADDSGPSV